MADEAFALSPISARSASPTDADYDAIRTAFMETARGRWFLDEYAKRNRNADTLKVLDAVERLEQNLAAQRAEAATSAHTPLPDIASSPPTQAEILASVKLILDRTRAALVAALSMPDMEEALGPFRRSARIVQEIAWGLRESGSDGRICDILDKQVSALIAACDALASAEHRDAVLHAFDSSLVQIDKLTESGHAPVTGELSATGGPAQSISSSEGSTLAAMQEAAPATRPADVAVDTVDITSVPIPVQAATEISVADEVRGDPTHDPEAAAVDTPAASSLGASLLAHGIVAQAASSRPDPLAPIRRMSQAEKIAFFS